ncbi:MAG: NfeD family protein [Bacilli bacterium]
MNIFFLVLIVILIIIEIISFNLETIWFIFGALIALLCTYFISDTTILLLIFTLSSLLALVSFNPILKKYIIKSKDSLPNNNLIGKTVNIVDHNEDDIIVKLNDVIWKAVCETKVDKNKKYQIIDVLGNKLKIKEI